MSTDTTTPPPPEFVPGRRGVSQAIADVRQWMVEYDHVAVHPTRATHLSREVARASNSPLRIIERGGDEQYLVPRSELEAARRSAPAKLRARSGLMVAPIGRRVLFCGSRRTAWRSYRWDAAAHQWVHEPSPQPWGGVPGGIGDLIVHPDDNCALVGLLPIDRIHGWDIHPACVDRDRRGTRCASDGRACGPVASESRRAVRDAARARKIDIRRRELLEWVDDIRERLDTPRPSMGALEVAIEQELPSAWRELMRVVRD